jgi:hypothetical protein
MILVTIAVVITITNSGFVTPSFASDLTIRDRISREDPLQDKVTICHIPEGDITKAHDKTVGESVVSDHLTHGDRIGHCSHSQNPAIIVEPPATCASTESGLVAYSRVILIGFPYGSVVLKGDQSSETPSLVEVQADKYSLPMGFSLGDKTLIAFADANRNTQQDPGEASAVTAFTITCW